MIQGVRRMGVQVRRDADQPAVRADCGALPRPLRLHHLRRAGNNWSHLATDYHTWQQLVINSGLHVGLYLIRLYHLRRTGRRRGVRRGAGAGLPHLSARAEVLPQARGETSKRYLGYFVIRMSIFVELFTVVHLLVGHVLLCFFLCEL